MTTCELGYTKRFSAKKIAAIEAWAAKWGATRTESKIQDVTLEDRNFSDGLIVPQEEVEAYQARRNARYAETFIEYKVENAGQECWAEQRNIVRMG